MKIKLRFLTLTLTLFMAGIATAQTDPQVCPTDQAVCAVENGQTLNLVINGDTTATGERAHADRIYELQRDGIYLMNADVRNDGYHLRVYGAESTEGAIPQVYTALNPTSGSPVGDPFGMQGDLTLRNFSFSGVLPEDVSGQLPDISTRIVRVRAPGFDLVMDRLIAVNLKASIVRAQSALRKFEMTNSVWANSGWLGDNGTNFGAGKGIDLRDGSIDSLIMRNNTFVNFTDRVLRHRNSTGPIQNMVFDHNTLINTISYHGMIALGVVGESIQITNNLFVDAFAAGADSSDVVRQEEFNESGELYANGNAKMNWIQSVPNETTNWNISNNHYAVSDELQAFYDAYGDGAGDDGNPDNGADGDNDIIGEGDPLTDHIMSRLTNPTTAFGKIDSPGFTNVPASPIGMLTWYRTDTGRTKETITFDAATDDYDRRDTAYFLDDFDASYANTSPAYTAGEGGCPVGDLTWFPEIDAAACIEAATAIERISAEVPSEFELMQNFPNPFNPQTNISYALPSASNVSLVVYNVMGQEVARLVDNQSQTAGVYNVTWGGVDQAGRSVPSGVYFYQLLSGNTQQTMKMTLIK
ncbi:MAG: T9SS type A sorting domain-containing protein [Rhodothermales bacterium]